MVTPKNSACIYIYMPIIVFGVSIIYFVDWLVLVVLYLLNSHFLALDTKNYKNFNFYLILLSSEYFKTSPFLITPQFQDTTVVFLMCAFFWSVR